MKISSYTQRAKNKFFAANIVKLCSAIGVKRKANERRATSSTPPISPTISMSDGTFLLWAVAI